MLKKFNKSCYDTIKEDDADLAETSEFDNKSNNNLIYSSMFKDNDLKKIHKNFSFSDINSLYNSDNTNNKKYSPNKNKKIQQSTKTKYKAFNQSMKKTSDVSSISCISKPNKTFDITDTAFICNNCKIFKEKLVKTSKEKMNMNLELIKVKKENINMLEKINSLEKTIQEKSALNEKDAKYILKQEKEIERLQKLLKNVYGSNHLQTVETIYDKNNLNVNKLFPQIVKPINDKDAFN
jgi:hypothetical protein